MDRNYELRISCFKKYEAFQEKKINIYKHSRKKNQHLQAFQKKRSNTYKHPRKKRATTTSVPGKSNIYKHPRKKSNIYKHPREKTATSTSIPEKKQHLQTSPNINIYKHRRKKTSNIYKHSRKQFNIYKQQKTIQQYKLHETTETEMPSATEILMWHDGQAICSMIAQYGWPHSNGSNELSFTCFRANA